MKALKLLAIMAVVCLTGCKQKYEYQTVENDPLKTKMYTLDNGLKVYMSVNKEQPRIQTFIAVHAGSKHEPTETTGLAHYLEHMMFKGSTNLGTINYEEEKVLLDKITELYEVYRATTDPEERKAVYHQIDSISYEASTYFIPNEYDKVMANIGSDGSNAFTSNDQTVYMEDIPSNQLENWAKIQSDRFKNMVLRGFHTELEAVYEEYNKYLNSDWDKLSNAVFGVLTPTHPYNHSVIGLGEHLKNPSLKNIMEFFNKYYVPNNVAICMSGDFDPDEAMDIIVKYFGDWEKNENLNQPEIEPQPELTAVVEKEVVTPNPESVLLTWRFDGINSHQSDTLALLAQVLHNGKAGLLDLDLNLPQKVNSSESEIVSYCDYTAFLLAAMPQPGQSLESLRDLLMQEVEKVWNGEFSEDLVKSIITEKKLANQHMLEDNSRRAMQYVDAFTNDVDWADEVGKLGRIEKLTKEDIVAFAKKYLKDNNFVCVYKRMGEDKDIKPVEKPAITPIQMNRDTVSVFAKEILNNEVKPIEPVFVDLQKDITYLTAKSDIPVLYRKNDLNGLFNLDYRYEIGTTSVMDEGLNRYIPLATEYINYLGTDSMSAEEIKQQFYLLGCRFDISCDMRTTTISLSGLQENMDKAMALMEKILSSAKPDSVALQNLIITKLQERENILKMFDAYSYFLRKYLQYGLSGVELELTNDELRNAATMGDKLVGIIKGLSQFEHTVTYYGPMETNNLLTLINDEHKTAESLAKVCEKNIPALIETKENECFILPYNGTQSFVMSQFACDGRPWSEDKLGVINMYNNYFGAGMNTVVFQEMREKRSLCYGAGARYIMPAYNDQKCTFVTTIQSQNDKLKECIDVFDDIVNNMPASQTSFDVAKKGVLTQLSTERVKRTEYFDIYFDAKDLDIDYDKRQKTYGQLQGITLQDIVDFQQQNVKGLHYRSVFAGDPNGLSKDELQRLGNVKTLTAHEVFGY
ncbi:MAG: insulinase family protein [Bacteroidaceae bacterium]|nr:insulinase family protein [Bacteroidaceae bacterium]